MANDKTWEEFRQEYVSEHASWAANALPVNMKAPSLSRIVSGWTIEQPPHNFFNWHMNRTDNRLVDAEARLAWLAQYGVAGGKPWAVHAATAEEVDVTDVQEGALIQTDEPIGGDLTAVIAQVETGATLSGSPSVVPSSYTVQQNAANRDASNLTAAGNAALAHAAMPSNQYIDLPVPSAPNVHYTTVPSDGFVLARGRATGSAEGAIFELAAGGCSTTQACIPGRAWGISACLAVQKGASIKINYLNATVDFVRFYYANGSAPTV